MDWFETLFGFCEETYEASKSNFACKDGTLTSLANNRSWRIGEFETPSLSELRGRFAKAAVSHGKPRVSLVQDDVRRMHAAPEYAGALFQVASQFNALEMPGPEVDPEKGVRNYEYDRTQGPACAMSAAPALVYRNYFAPVAGGEGQTRDRQFDGLADVGEALASALGCSVADLWRMRNGYALCSEDGLKAISAHLSDLDEDGLNDLRGRLRIAVQRNVEVTATGAPPEQRVTQVFGSALPVAYCDHDPDLWTKFATLVLQASYEATLLETAIGAARGSSNVVLLTLLGGGAFGNDRTWIYQAIRRALSLCASVDLDIRIVSYGRPERDLVEFVHEFE